MAGEALRRDDAILVGGGGRHRRFSYSTDWDHGGRGFGRWAFCMGSLAAVQQAAMDEAAAMDNTIAGKRLRFVAVGFAVAGALLVFAYGYYMLSGEARPGASRAERTVVRGPILDRYGHVLAIETELDTVIAWTPDVDDPDSVAAILAPILLLDQDALLQRLRRTRADVVVARKVTPTQSGAIRAHMEAGSLAGVRLRREPARTYPEQDMAAHVVGFVGTDHVGLSGVEYALNSVLSPPAAGDESIVQGRQVFLTIDSAIQQFTDSLAEQVRIEEGADSVSIVLLDANSADVLAYSSAPAYDPNVYLAFDPTTWRNRPILDIYEPGSVFKVFSLSAFLQLGGISDATRIATSGGYRNEYMEETITDLGDYGVVTPSDIIRLSSNVGAAYASETVNDRSFYNIITKFGFGEETGIEFGGEQRGLLRDADAWSARSKPTIAMGQEIGVTVMQMAAAATVLTNGGVLLRPHIVDRVLDSEGRVVQETRREVVREVVEPWVAERMLAYMEAAVGPTGTARRAAVPGLRISAKTGTAQSIDPETGQYSEDAFVASTLAVFPTDDPKIIAYIAIHHPKADSTYGGVIGAPRIRAIAEYLRTYLGLESEDRRSAQIPQTVTIEAPRLPAFDDRLPDLRGLPKRALIPLFDHEDLIIVVDGSGFVRTQTPPPGTEIYPGMVVTLELE